MTVDSKAFLQPASLFCPIARPIYSDDDDPPSIKKIIAHSKSIIDLTLGDDDNSAGDKNAIEVS
jgi:hypothetical protein